MWTTRYEVSNGGMMIETFATEEEAENKVAEIRAKYPNLKLSGLCIKPYRIYTND